MTNESKIETLKITRDTLARCKWEKFQHRQFQELKSIWNQLQQISDQRIKKDIASEHYIFTEERKKA